MPGLVFVCSPGRAPWVYAALRTAGRPGAACSTARRPSTSSGTARVCPGSHQFPEEVGRDTGLLLPVLLLPYRRFEGPVEEAPRQPAGAYGRRLDGRRPSTRLRTWFPNAPWAHGDGGLSEGTAGPRTVTGLAVDGRTRPVGLPGQPTRRDSPVATGIGHSTTCFGSGGVYVQSESAHLTARGCWSRPAEVRGLAAVAEKVELGQRPDTGGRVRGGAWRWMPRRRRTPSGSSPCTLGRRAPTVLVVPRAGRDGGVARPTCRPPGVVAEFHSHGRHRAFFSATDDRDEQGFRVYGVVGRLDKPEPELTLRLGIYGHFASLEWQQAFDGPPPGLRLASQEPTPTPYNPYIRR